MIASGLEYTPWASDRCLIRGSSVLVPLLVPIRYVILICYDLILFHSMTDTESDYYICFLEGFHCGAYTNKGMYLFTSFSVSLYFLLALHRVVNVWVVSQRIRCLS